VSAEVDERCGTYAGVMQHRKLKEPACDECREAQREYMHAFRARKGPGNDRWWGRTRNTALQRLAEEYPERFRELLAEVRKDGPTPWDPGDTP
jgi:hypothetical protein